MVKVQVLEVRLLTFRSHMSLVVKHYASYSFCHNFLAHKMRIVLTVPSPWCYMGLHKLLQVKPLRSILGM